MCVLGASGTPSFLPSTPHTQPLTVARQRASLQGTVPPCHDHQCSLGVSSYSHRDGPQTCPNKTPECVTMVVVGDATLRHLLLTYPASLGAGRSDAGCCSLPLGPHVSDRQRCVVQQLPRVPKPVVWRERQALAVQGCSSRDNSSVERMCVTR